MNLYDYKITCSYISEDSPFEGPTSKGYLMLLDCKHPLLSGKERSKNERTPEFDQS
jgi:hypothetical protein